MIILSFHFLKCSFNTVHFFYIVTLDQLHKLLFSLSSTVFHTVKLLWFLTTLYTPKYCDTTFFWIFTHYLTFPSKFEFYWIFFHRCYDSFVSVTLTQCYPWLSSSILLILSDTDNSFTHSFLYPSTIHSITEYPLLYVKYWPLY